MNEMSLSKLQERAMQIREKFGQYEESQTGKRWTRQDIMMGFVGDVGDLAKLVMAMEGSRHIPDKEAKLAHELADCLWAILILAQMYEVDIEAAFSQTMDELEGMLNQKQGDLLMLSEFELAILRIVASFETGINWHGIAIRLSNINLPERPDQLATQKHLAKEGLLYYESEKGIWQITEAGLIAISNSKSDLESK